MNKKLNTSLKLLRENKIQEVMRAKCPVCNKATGYYEEGVERKPYPLYQRSYPGTAEYVSPRCSDCYDGLKEVAKVKIVTDITALRKPCEPAMSGDDVQGLATTLFSTMVEYRGQGLAANQIGVDRRVFVMKMEGRTPICIVNPVIMKEKGSQESNESCLSLPGIVVQVKRPLRVRVKGFNQYWIPVSYGFVGIEARRACHEIDHLIGKLIIDYREEGVK